MPSGPAVLAFGETHRFDDGSTVTLTAARFVPTVPNPGWHGQYVLLSGTLTNGQNAPISAQTILVTQSGGQPVTEITLSDPAVHRADGFVLPGESRKFSQSYQVPDATAEFAVSVIPPRHAALEPGNTAQIVYFKGTPTG